MSCEKIDTSSSPHSAYACGTCGNCDWHCACMVKAQHDETGRMWEGMRHRLPRGYSILPEQSLSQSERT